MEILSRLLRQLPKYSWFSYHPKCVKFNLTHLVFADDLLVFTKGDVPSVDAVARCLGIFAWYSGLQANPLKTCLYYGGVANDVIEDILRTTGFTQGEFPFRYLGIPLFPTRLHQNMFQPLLDKITRKLAHWAKHTLSYAGKVTLTNSVIFVLQNFWGASILLPKGIVKKIHQLYQRFFWGYDNESRRMIFKSWNSFCYPRAEGGIDMKEVLAWNQTQLLKWFWKLEHQPQILWVQWTKAYIIRHVDVWQLPPRSSDSWYWSNLLKVRDWFMVQMGTIEDAKLVLAGDNATNYAGSVLYELIRNKKCNGRWASLMGENLCVPKHMVISLLPFQNCLTTTDNLNKRGLVIINRCSLCEAAMESADHLFFLCPFSAALWNLVFAWLKIGTITCSLSRIITWSPCARQRLLEESFQEEGLSTLDKMGSSRGNSRKPSIEMNVIAALEASINARFEKLENATNETAELRKVVQTLLVQVIKMEEARIESDKNFENRLAILVANQAANLSRKFDDTPPLTPVLILALTPPPQIGSTMEENSSVLTVAGTGLGKEEPRKVSDYDLEFDEPDDPRAWEAARAVDDPLSILDEGVEWSPAAEISIAEGTSYSQKPWSEIFRSFH
ncbi:uncharacterized protein LOC141630553 [Silene latifolia]|uniref:uncharacterized protein LOC141630553 n=1 Tax=Silene latifolia TaxID=37657 RepID=UPI003D7846C2